MGSRAEPPVAGLQGWDREIRMQIWAREELPKGLDLETGLLGPGLKK